MEQFRTNCHVLQTINVTCTIVSGTNNFIVENYFKETNQGGKLIQLLIGPANNPISARLAGNWAVWTET